MLNLQVNQSNVDKIKKKLDDFSRQQILYALIPLLLETFETDKALIYLDYTLLQVRSKGIS